MECPTNISNSLSVTAFKTAIETHSYKFAMNEKFMKALLNCTMNIFQNVLYRPVWSGGACGWGGSGWREGVTENLTSLENI